MDTKVKKAIENLILAAEGVCLFADNERCEKNYALVTQYWVKCLNTALNDLKKLSLEVPIDRA